MEKVLIFIQDAVGGAERMSVLIGKALAKEGKEVVYSLVENRLSSSILDFIPQDARIIRIPMGNAIRIMLAMLAVIRREKPQFVFASVLNINNKILPFRFLFPKTKIIIRCDNYLYTYTDRQRKIVAALYPMADMIIGQTEEMRDELIALNKFKENQVITLHNPIDIDTIYAKLKDAENPYPSNGLKHFVASGRFAYQKGFDFLVEAFSKVSQERTDCDLYIIGDFEYGNRKVYNMITEKAKKNNIEGKVHCVGYQKNPYPYIKYADCFVLSSRWEGLPNVLIEALHLGTPVAAFRCIPIIERIIDNGGNGFTAEKENVTSLAQAMSKSVDLGRIHSSYKSSQIEDFTKLFIE